MKLKTPIVVTITHVENAVMTTLKCLNKWNFYGDTRHARIGKNCASGEVLHQISSALKAQGIDVETWEPPAPLLIASHPVTANPDGSIKVGCTAVTRAELEAAYKLSTEAMQQEPVWPKWFRKKRGHDLIRFDDQTSFGTWFTNGLADSKSEIYTYEGMCAGEYSVSFNQITDSQAVEFLKGQKR